MPVSFSFNIREFRRVIRNLIDDVRDLIRGFKPKPSAATLLDDRDFSGRVGTRISVAIIRMDLDPYYVDPSASPVARAEGSREADRAAREETRLLVRRFRDSSVKLSFQPSGMIVLSQIVRETGLRAFQRAVDGAAYNIAIAYTRAYYTAAARHVFETALQ